MMSLWPCRGKRRGLGIGRSHATSISRKPQFFRGFAMTSQRRHPSLDFQPDLTQMWPCQLFSKAAALRLDFGLPSGRLGPRSLLDAFTQHYTSSPRGITELTTQPGTTSFPTPALIHWDQKASKSFSSLQRFPAFVALLLTGSDWPCSFYDVPVLGGQRLTVGVLATTITLLTHSDGPPRPLHQIPGTCTGPSTSTRLLDFQVRALLLGFFPAWGSMLPAISVDFYLGFCLLLAMQSTPKVVFLSFWGVGPPSLVVAVGSEPCHGRLDPRSRADVERANRRKSLPLDDGRPVLEKTRKERKVLLDAFSLWLEGIGTSIDDLLDPAALDIEAINLALEKYGRQLYQSGRPYNHYAETINAVSSKRPSIRRMMQGSWDLAYTWLREEPPVHHVALPWQILLAAVVTSALWGWFDVAAILCISWGGLARIGEVLKAQALDPPWRCW